jgi:hypothetical protein
MLAHLSFVQIELCGYSKSSFFETIKETLVVIDRAAEGLQLIPFDQEYCCLLYELHQAILLYFKGRERRT